LSERLPEVAALSDAFAGIAPSGDGGRSTAAPLHDYKQKCGVGIGELAGQAFRIAHMGHINAPMILGTLGVIEVGLNALGIPHGKGGTEAAIEWLVESVSA
jgi:alanine-glyoxylate transaminase/serine-glyoxylate transaminase/serine-pyruvate transaminase